MDYYKFNLFLNINIEDCVPNDILNYIITLFIKLPRIRVFTGQNTTVIIKDGQMYCHGYKIFGQIFNKGIVSLDGIDVNNIKKIAFGNSFSLILTYDHKAYRVSLVDRVIHIMDNVANISAFDLVSAYITNNGELFIQGTYQFNHSIPINYISPVKVNIENVKDIILDSYTVLFRSGKVAYIKQKIEFLITPYITQISKGIIQAKHSSSNIINNWLHGITKDNMVIEWEALPMLERTRTRYDDFDIIGCFKTIIPDIQNVIMSGSCKIGTFILNRQGELYLRENDYYSKRSSDYYSEIKLEEFVKMDLPAIESIHCGTDHIIAVTMDNQILGWGHNELGQLNISDKIRYTPIKIKL